jgi:hypothetical protein
MEQTEKLIDLRQLEIEKLHQLLAQEEAAKN